MNWQDDYKKQVINGRKSPEVFFTEYFEEPQSWGTIYIEEKPHTFVQRGVMSFLLYDKKTIDGETYISNNTQERRLNLDKWKYQGMGDGIYQPFPERGLYPDGDVGILDFVENVTRFCYAPFGFAEVHYINLANFIRYSVPHVEYADLMTVSSTGERRRVVKCGDGTVKSSNAHVRALLFFAKALGVKLNKQAPRLVQGEYHSDLKDIAFYIKATEYGWSNYIDYSFRFDDLLNMNTDSFLNYKGHTIGNGIEEIKSFVNEHDILKRSINPALFKRALSDEEKLQCSYDFINIWNTNNKRKHKLWKTE